MPRRQGQVLLPALVALTLTGCGSDSNVQSYEANFKVERSAPNSKSLTIVVDGSSCAGVPGSRDRIDHVDVKETGEAVTLTVYADSGNEPEGGVCGGVGETLRREVELESPLDGRDVLNGKYESGKPVQTVAS